MIGRSSSFCNGVALIIVAGLLSPVEMRAQDWKVYNYQELLELPRESGLPQDVLDRLRELPSTAGQGMKARDLAYVMFRIPNSEAGEKEVLSPGSCPEYDPNDETTVFGIFKFKVRGSETTRFLALTDNSRDLRTIARYEHLFPKTHIADDAIYLSPRRLRKLNWLSKLRNGSEDLRDEKTVRSSFDLHWLFEIEKYFVIFAGLSRPTVEAYIVLDCQPRDELQPLVVQTLVGERPRIVDTIGLSIRNGVELALDLRLRKIGTGHDSAEIARELGVSIVSEDGRERFLKSLGVRAEDGGEELGVSFQGTVGLSVLEATALQLRLSETSNYRFVVGKPYPYLETVWKIDVEDVVEERAAWPPEVISVVKSCGSRLRSPHGLDLNELYSHLIHEGVGETHRTASKW